MPGQEPRVQAFESVRYPILPEVELADTPGSDAARRARREILHIRHYSLYAPRDFDVSPFFAIVKPRLEQAFDHHTLEWRIPTPPCADDLAGPGSAANVRSTDGDASAGAADRSR